MLSQVLHVIEPLLLDKDKAALQAHLTKSLLVLLLQVKFETFHVLEGVTGGAIVDGALHSTEFDTCLFDFIALVVDGGVFLVGWKAFLELCLTELLESKSLRLRYQ